MDFNSSSVIGAPDQPSYIVNIIGRWHLSCSRSEMRIRVGMSDARPANGLSLLRRPESILVKQIMYLVRLKTTLLLSSSLVRRNTIQLLHCDNTVWSISLVVERQGRGQHHVHGLLWRCAEWLLVHLRHIVLHLG